MDRKVEETEPEIADGNDDEDEFFGSQDDDEAEFGALGRHDNLSKDNELQTIGYFESYDETKESLLQEGFEVGYRETYDVALRLGRLFGQLSAETSLLPCNSSVKEESYRHFPETARRLHNFLTEFQNGSTNENLDSAKESIELLEQEIASPSEQGR